MTVAQGAPIGDRRMRERVGARLSWVLCAVSVALVVLGLVYGAWNHDSLRACH